MNNVVTKKSNRKSYSVRKLERRAQDILGTGILMLKDEFQLSGTREALEVFEKIIRETGIKSLVEQ